MISPLAYTDSLRVGNIDFVSPDKIEVLLDTEAPANIALNTGNPRPFPRINSYVLIPSEGGFLVAQVEWIGIERSPYPKRKGLKDFGIIDLPFPLRKMSLMPLGILRERRLPAFDNLYSFSRGVEVFPTVGDPVLLPTQEQLLAVIESGDNRRIKIGVSPLAGNADVLIDPDKLFGRHLAVLGNTGSGKSCSVAGLIRWSLENVSRDFSDKHPNARFVILDPNGEYAKAFADTKDTGIQTKIFRVGIEDESVENVFPLRVPLWFWNSAEWCSFAQASAKMQRPLLHRALREIRSGRDFSDFSEEEKKLRLRRYLSSNLITFNRHIESGYIRNEPTKFGFLLKTVENDLRLKSTSDYSEYKSEIDAIRCKMNKLITLAYQSFIDKTSKIVEYYTPFEENATKEVSNSILSLLNQFGGIIYQEGPSEDIPLPFRGTDFADHIQMLGEQEGVSQYIDFLVMRIRTMLSDIRMKTVIGDSDKLTLESWLNDYLGQGNSISIIDLSLVPTEIVHITVSVIARIIFEALQRYRRSSTGQTLPTVLVMEEAHTFVKRYKDDLENQDTATICCQIFEKIAKEGRKFGLGLVLSSQRPSELSPTVLSQCNSFLLHRINNDNDQEQVQKFIPDNLRGLLRELPALPSRNAILLGWASEIPVLVQMNVLPQMQRPQSDDPDFWNVWTGTERKANWKEIANNWQK